MDGLRQEVLAGAGLALQQHRRVGDGNAFEQREQLAHRLRSAEGLAEAICGVRLGDGSVVEHGDAERRRRAKPQGRVARDDHTAELRFFEEGAVRRVEIGDAQPFGAGLQLDVKSRDVLVAQKELGVAMAADENRALENVDHTPLIGPFDDADVTAARAQGRLTTSGETPA